MVYLGSESAPPASNTHSSKHSNNGQEDRNGSNGDAAHSGAGASNASRTRDVSPMSLDRELGPHQGHQERDRDDSSGDDEREGRIRVGKDYQVMPPEWIPLDKRRPEQCPERALLVWSPNNNITNAKLDEYIQISKEKYGYNAEQALGMLFWHKHDLDRAIQDLANFTPFPDEWSVEDKVLFEQAFQFHGKSFHRIRQMLPDKSIAQLVKYYYGWKKTRTRTSLMDRQARKLQTQREDLGTFGEEGHEPSDEEEKEAVQVPKPKCFNCGIQCHLTHSTPKGQMCGTCHQYYQRTGHVRPTTGPARKDGSTKPPPATQKFHSILKNQTRPPKGMYINHDDLVALATGPSVQGEQILKSMDREIVSYKRVVQSNKQVLSSLQRRNRDKNVDPYRIPDPFSKINAKWTDEELLLGVQGIRTFGKNFKVISEVIGSKTESHCRSFFVNYRRRFNLDSALKEYEAEHGPTPNDDDMDTDLNPSKSGSDGSNPNSEPSSNPPSPAMNIKKPGSESGLSLNGK